MGRLASAALGGCFAEVLGFFVVVGLVSSASDISGELQGWFAIFLSWPFLAYFAWRGQTLRVVWGRSFLVAGALGLLAVALIVARFPIDRLVIGVAVATEVSLILAFALLRKGELSVLANRVRSEPRTAIQVGLIGVVLVLLIPVLSSVLPKVAPLPALAPRKEGTFAKDAGEETYHFDGRYITLHQGIFRQPYADWLKSPRNPYDTAAQRALYMPDETIPPGSSRIATVQLTGQLVRGDAANDGLPDEAVIFTFNTGGDTTWYFVTLRRTNGEWFGETTNSVLLGDRVRVEQVRIEGGSVLVDVVERKPGESPSATPSVRVTREFRVRIGSIEEVKP